MTKYLLLFTIGPVKSFIQESRKAQDLYASSSLLSNLCKDTILDATTKFENYSFDLITPSIEIDILGESTFPSIPNRFLATLTTDNIDEIETITKGIEEKLKSNFSKIELDGNTIPLPKGTEEQLKNHLDIRWVLLPYIDTTYKENFLKINRLLAGIKNHNPVIEHDELGRKCIVDGKRNVKFYRESKDKEIYIANNLYNKLYQEEGHVTVLSPKIEKNDLLKIWHLQKGEGISAVTLKKRLFQNKVHQFPSTVTVALMHVFENLKDDENFIAYKTKVNGENRVFGHSNDQLFYKENIKPLFEKEKSVNGKITTELQKKITGFEKKHHKWSTELNLPMTKYYALIRFDGDNMGDWFSGIFKNDTISLKEYHQKLSGFLIGFADKIKKEILEPKGRVIYAGGEDFMAMINLHHLKESVDLIRTQFKKLVSNKMQQYLIKKDKPEITLSMGITIAHYKEPLQLVLDKTAKMEKKAKNGGRNSFSIRISKHSGGQLETIMSWNSHFEAIYNIVTLVKNKEISPAFIIKTYEFCKEMNFDIGAKDVIKSKMKLFTKRALLVDANKTTYKSTYSNLLSFIEKETEIENFAELLLIIDFIQRHEYKK